MLGQVFHIYGAESAQAHVQRHVRGLDALDFHALHDLAGEVQAGRRSRHRANVLGVDGLVALLVGGLGFAVNNFLGQGRFAQLVEGLAELLVGAIKQELDGAAARGGVVDNLGHHVRLAEIQLVAHADFAGGVHQHVPQAQLLVQLAEQEYFDFSAGFFFVAVEAGRKNLGVVEHKNVALDEIIENIFEGAVLNLAGGAVHHHQAALVAVAGGVQCH